jgi:hypothetical protein
VGPEYVAVGLRWWQPGSLGGGGSLFLLVTAGHTVRGGRDGVTRWWIAEELGKVVCIDVFMPWRRPWWFWWQRRREAYEFLCRKGVKRLPKMER